ncbi:MAG: cupin domain-containing protein [Sphingomicrobium sp.]
MKNHRNYGRSTAISVVAVSALVGAALSAAPALATPGSGFVPSPVANGHFGTLSINTAGDKTDKWGMVLKTLDDTDVGADRLTVQPQGYSGWHAHPAPVFVTVTQGTIEWFDDALCAAHTYHTGQSFIEPAYRAHNVRNPAATGGTVAEFIAIVVKPAGFVGPAFRINRDQPSSC